MQHASRHFDDGAICTFCNPILFRRIWRRLLVGNSFLAKVRFKLLQRIFTTIVRSQDFNTFVRLIFSGALEVFEFLEDLVFMAKKIYERFSRLIIDKDNEVPLLSNRLRAHWPADVAMHNFEELFCARSTISGERVLVLFAMYARVTEIEFLTFLELKTLYESPRELFDLVCG